MAREVRSLHLHQLCARSLLFGVDVCPDLSLPEFLALVLFFLGDLSASTDHLLSAFADCLERVIWGVLGFFLLTF